MEQVEMLALVFVQPLDLHIKDCRRIHIDPAIPCDDAGQINLVGKLHIHELLLKVRVCRVRLQSTEFIQIAFPSASDLGCDQLAQARVAGKQPTPGRNPIGLVVEFFGIEGVKLRKEIAFE